MARVLVALGSNIEPRRNLPAALRLLAERERLLAVSRAFETAPAVGARGPVFWNAAALIETALPPERLKHERLRGIEAELGRRRGSDKNAPRTIDLDIGLYGDRVIDHPALGLRVPDPDLLVWAHALLPAADVAPDWRHPEDGRRLGAIAAGFAAVRGVRLLPLADFDPAAFVAAARGG